MGFHADLKSAVMEIIMENRGYSLGLFGASLAHFGRPAPLRTERSSFPTHHWSFFIHVLRGLELQT